MRPCNLGSMCRTALHCDAQYISYTKHEMRKLYIHIFEHVHVSFGNIYIYATIVHFYIIHTTLNDTCYI